MNGTIDLFSFNERPHKVPDIKIAINKDQEKNIVIRW